MNSAHRMTERTVEVSARSWTKVASDLELPSDTIEVVPVRALLLGERLDTRALERDTLGVAPSTVDIPDGGVAVLFRYGVAVLFGDGIGEWWCGLN
jgi:hypothetical protein